MKCHTQDRKYSNFKSKTNQNPIFIFSFTWKEIFVIKIFIDNPAILQIVNFTSRFSTFNLKTSFIVTQLRGRKKVTRKILEKVEMINWSPRIPLASFLSRPSWPEFFEAKGKVSIGQDLLHFHPSKFWKQKRKKKKQISRLCSEVFFIMRLSRNNSSDQIAIDSGDKKQFHQKQMK